MGTDERRLEIPPDSRSWRRSVWCFHRDGFGQLDMRLDDHVGLESLRTLYLGEKALYGANKNTCSLELNSRNNMNLRGRSSAAKGDSVCE